MVSNAPAAAQYVEGERRRHYYSLPRYYGLLVFDMTKPVKWKKSQSTVYNSTTHQ